MNQTVMLSLLCGILAMVGMVALAMLIHTLLNSGISYRVEVHVQTGVEVETGRLVFSDCDPTNKEEPIPGTFVVQQGGGTIWRVRLQDPTGKVYEKTFAGRLMLGRVLPGQEPEQCLYIGTESSISRQQCLLYEQGGILYLANCSTVNPTSLDGKLLQEAEPLHVGSVIQIGGRQLRLLQLQKCKRKG